MGLHSKITEALKVAMKSKDTVALDALRAVKSALLLAKTESGASAELSEADEMKLLQKLVKQRKDSASLYAEQGRADLAQSELAQVAVIEQFLPEQLSENEIENEVANIITEIGASTMKDIGKVMSIATQRLSGRADGKIISAIVKKLLQ